MYELPPSGCTDCGYPQSRHGWFGHKFVAPSQELILARMLKRRALRRHPGLAAEPPDGALVLGHELRPVTADLSRDPERQAERRWYCGRCGQYAWRSGGNEQGAAAKPCTSRQPDAALQVAFHADASSLVAALNAAEQLLGGQSAQPQGRNERP